MKKSIILLLAALNTCAFARTIEWGTVDFTHLEDTKFGDCRIDVNSRDFSTWFFCVASDQSADGITLSPNGGQLAPAMRWVEMQKGESVNTETTGTNLDDYFYKFDTSPSIWGDITIEAGISQSVYLGFVILDEFWDEDDNLYYVPGVFGWLELWYDGEYIHAGMSGIDLDGDPLRVGMIPEPSTSLLALSGLALLFRRRRM